MIDFNDLLDIRVGSDQMTMGSVPTHVEPLTTPQQWHAKADALRSLYLWTLGRRPDGFDQPLDLRIESEKPFQGVTRRTVSYMVGPGERIKAEILFPQGTRGRIPAVLTIHPTNKTGRLQCIGLDPEGSGLDWAYGLELAQRGYVTLSYDIDSTNDRSYPGERAFGNSPLYTQCPEWSARGKDLYDVARALDVLEQTPEADATRIGCIGHSQGGGITTDAMAVDPRIKAGVNNCGDWPFRASKNPYNRCRTGWWIGNPQLRPFALTGKPMPIDLHEKLALAAPRPQLVILSLADFGYTLEEESFTRSVAEAMSQSVRKVYDLLGNPGAFEVDLHTEGHAFKRHHRDRAYAFLDRHLKGE